MITSNHLFNYLCLVYNPPNVHLVTFTTNSYVYRTQRVYCGDAAGRYESSEGWESDNWTVQQEQNNGKNNNINNPVVFSTAPPCGLLLLLLQEGFFPMSYSRRWNVFIIAIPPPIWDRLQKKIDANPRRFKPIRSSNTRRMNGWGVVFSVCYSPPPPQVVNNMHTNHAHAQRGVGGWLLWPHILFFHRPCC